MANRQFRRRDDDDRHGFEDEHERPPLSPDDIKKSRPRTPPREFMREVRGELRKVAWPNREEVVSYTIVVLVATLVLIGIVFAMDFVFGELVFLIFD